MTQQSLPIRAAYRPSLMTICLGAMVLVILTAARLRPDLPADFMRGDNDDLMRLAVIRDWLGGQSWFDTRQYRLLPPEGISLHWSRYIDAGIAAILVPASWFLSQPQAEMLALLLWPVLLSCLMVLVIGFGTGRLFGRAAAIAALALFLTWKKFFDEFTPGRIDHHNVQLLCATVVFYLAVLPGRPLLRGALAGAVCAFSFAVGLEMLPVLLLIQGLVTLRWVFRDEAAGRWLLGSALALALAAPLLMAGQVPYASWAVRYCDVLAPPLFSLIAAGIFATVLPVLAGSRLRAPVWRLLAVIALAAIGLALAWPLLGPCLAGPYAEVSPEARLIIDTRITEARSVPDLLGGPWAQMVLSRLLPALMIGLFAAIALWRLRRALTPGQKAALLQGLIVLVIGFAFAMTQFRATNLLAPALPMLAGFVVYAFLTLSRRDWRRIPAALLLLLAFPPLCEFAIARALALTAAPAAATAEQTALARRTTCRSTAAMKEIAALPEGSVVFSTLNLGAAILVYTPQSATSAPYHRSTAAFWNGVGAFNSQQELRDALLSSKADFLALCRGSKIDEEMPAVREMLESGPPAWLVETDYPQDSMTLLRVDKAALQANAAAP